MPTQSMKFGLSIDDLRRGILNFKKGKIPAETLVNNMRSAYAGLPTINQVNMALRDMGRALKSR